MKKSKKIFIIAATTLSTLSLTACKDVKRNGDKFISFTNVNGERTSYSATELFEKYTKSNQQSSSDYYNAIYNVMVREWFNLSKNSSLKKECEKQAKVKLDSTKSTVSKNAHDNGTKYDKEWEKILNTELNDIHESKRNEHELLLKYQIDSYKTKLKDVYYDNYKTWKKNTETSNNDEEENNLFWGKKGYLKEKLPYHVKHVLVNVEATIGAYHDGKISANNVEKLYLVLNQLAKQVPFGQVAQDYSDDSGSAKTFGDLGIMDTSTSFVNEFKLGIYAYDTYFNNNSEVNKSLEGNKNPFAVPEKDAKYLKSLGIADIPYDAIVKMNELKDVVTDKNNKKVNNGESTYYPRNILFNKYFNNHNLAFITPNNLLGEKPALKNEDDKLNKHYSDLNNEGKWNNGAENPTYAALKGFQEIKLKNYDKDGNFIGTTNKKVLCDDKGNPIIVVRAGTTSYQGVHFIVVERSALEENKSISSNGETYNVPLNEYYANENPLTSGGSKNKNFPQTKNGNQKQTYVNFYNTTYDKYNERITKIKNTVKNFDNNYELRIFNWLEKQLTIKYNAVSDVNIEKKVHDYINVKFNYELSNNRLNKEKTWNTFIEELEIQQERRKTKLIPETCALHFQEGFKDNADSDIKEICYYEN